ncbi:MAG: hypothetical protein IIW14_03500, partial [Kiritimatiellae bacterium]|nr:hypothetical protein [Kiritimatiellia bacterium]
MLLTGLVLLTSAGCGEDVLAFYPFDDRPDGSSAVGFTVFNAAQPQFSPCNVKTGSGNSVAVFSSEGPAKYIFAGERYGAEPYCTDPGSVFLSSSANGDSGTLAFYRMASELSKCHESGHTVEWFFKLTDDKYAACSASYVCNAGYKHGESQKPASLYLPFSQSYSEGRQFRFALDSYSNTDRCLTRDLDYKPADGLWHHIAIVESGADGGSKNLSLYVDYIKQGEVAVDGTAEIADDRDLNLVRNVLHGKFSCVKVTKRALGADEFLRASNIATYWPRTLAYATFDGEPGSDVASPVENGAVSFADMNPGVFSAQDVEGSYSVYYAVAGNPCYSGNRACRRPQVSGEGAVRTNCASAYVASQDPGGADFRLAPNFRMQVPSRHNLPADFTMEGFFRFDKSSWAQNVGEFASNRDRLCLLSRKLSSGYSWKINFVDALSRTSHRLQLTAFWGAEGGNCVDVLTSKGILQDDVWHHIAVTHDAARNRMVVFCDYKPVATNDLGGKALYCPPGGWFSVGDGRNVSDNNFHGWVDEVRYSGVCLEPKDFLRQKKMPAGMSVKVR